MRVISGIAKGHRLISLEGFNTRPTSDRIKETLFNIISPDIVDINFLDIFSGTGSIGIEALSRGANSVVFVDNSKDCIDIIKHNLNHTKLYDKAKIYCSDVILAINTLKLEGLSFDIVFMDPPYDMGFYKPVILALKEAKIINKYGYIIAEHSSNINIPNIEGLKILREKKFKKTVITFMTLED